MIIDVLTAILLSIFVATSPPRSCSLATIYTIVAVLAIIVITIFLCPHLPSRCNLSLQLSSLKKKKREKKKKKKKKKKKREHRAVVLQFLTVATPHHRPTAATTIALNLFLSPASFFPLAAIPSSFARHCHLAAFFKSTVSHRCSAAIAVALCHYCLHPHLPLVVHIAVLLTKGPDNTTALTGPSPQPSSFFSCCCPVPASTPLFPLLGTAISSPLSQLHDPAIAILSRCSSIGHIATVFCSRHPCFCFTTILFLNCVIPFAAAIVSIAAHVTRIADLNGPYLHHRRCLSIITTATQKPSPFSLATTCLLLYLLLYYRR
ncbi:hypothetical protein GW17_00039243 [Ensete ventricosum]|nr:hypothetical protein GW17_00039243 [Ensete ventricosum]